MQEKHYLASLFEPSAVAVIGSDADPDALGRRILRKLIQGGFSGAIHAIGDATEPPAGCRHHAALADMPDAVDLAVIARPLHEAAALIEQCGRKGVKTAILPTGFADSAQDNPVLARRISEQAERFGMHVLGPNALGVLRPAAGLDASTAHIDAGTGSIGLISQSASLCCAILDWARPNQVGFSAVVSVGAGLDIDFGDVLDYLITDPRTESIILHIERIRDARRFMSALRGAARVKPVMLIKAGRHASVAELIDAGNQPRGDDRVFNAAIGRCGVVRLYNIGQLFAATNALFAHLHPQGDRLAIVTNGGGLGMMAADRAADLHIPLAAPSDTSRARLRRSLPIRPRHFNPLDLGASATEQHYAEAIETLGRDGGTDGVLVMLSPQSTTRPTAVAEIVCKQARHAKKPLLACWMGEEHVHEGRRLLRAAGIPTFRTPEPAIELFSHLSSYYRNQKLLVQVPGSLSHQAPPSIDSARLVIEGALAETRNQLGELETKSCLAAFRVPITPAFIARSATEAVMLAEQVGLPVAMKIDSPSVLHKAEVGGIRLNLSSTPAVRNAYQEILDEVGRNRPEAQLNGVVIEPMIKRGNARELSLSVRTDPVFGPYIALGEGGSRTGMSARSEAVALPPLNEYLARDMLHSGPLATLLARTRQLPPIDEQALQRLLLRVSEMACELPWMEALHIDPLIVDEHAATVLDAQMHIRPVDFDTDRYAHMAIHPYPSHLVERWTLPDGIEVAIRPIRPEDAALENEFVRALSPESRYLRFMNTIRELSPAMVVRLTQIDYDREMAFVATTEEHGREIEIGVCRYATNADGRSCEFAIVVADAWQRRGIAHKLMDMLIDTARKRGLQTMKGIFLARNEPMLRFAGRLGFELCPDEEDNTLRIGTLDLQP